VLLGNGSDELIQMLILAVARPGAVVLAPEPTFVMYRLIAHWLGVRFVGVPLRADDFGLDRAAMLAAIAQYQPALVFLACPNNPTGNLFDRDDVLAILDAAPGAVVVDEAYAPFTAASFLEQVGSRPELLVMRTLSKAGLAGLRLGILAGPAAWIAQIDKVRLPYNINVLTHCVILPCGRIRRPRSAPSGPFWRPDWRRCRGWRSILPKRISCCSVCRRGTPPAFMRHCARAVC
jgi:histidinol-phosphate aminotransferase